MPKQALILDLDNTIYPVQQIGQDLFCNLFQLISESGEYQGSFEEVKKEIMRKPYQRVAAEFNFSEKLSSEGFELLKNITYEKPMTPFEDYVEIKKIALPKFLVTTGFTTLQRSKIKQLGIEKDFEEIHIVDPALSFLTKKKMFKEILSRHSYLKSDVLVVGDDPHSEIQAAKQSGIDWVLYDTLRVHPDIDITNKIFHFKQLAAFL
ncbi:MAG TPA: HAD family hydrolase [Panacibacter sp.]|nr:HAD family hydrolase [Panacibacter sp.]HNP43108.1 HAD family hydrolase [Panacibacter sp.]